ncbi:hypothetical protein [Niveibacterium sp. SC-1]|uniref:hypothetical protein n=1 Tax=Niveibacterium sp. SC-1 TaxID=3135646 RepID=UPI0031204EC7
MKTVGRFRLFYKDSTTELPCEGVHYRIMASDRVVVAGVTHANGETVDVTRTSFDTRFELQVLDARARRYVPPEIHHESEYDALLKLDTVREGGRALHKVRIKPYYELRFFRQQGGQPLANASFTAYTLAPDGKEAVAQGIDGGPLRGKTDSEGKTDILYCASAAHFRFTVPGTSITAQTAPLRPLFRGMAVTRYDFPFKTVSATTARDPAHQVRLSGKKPLPMVGSLEDQELLVIPQKEWDEFEAFSSHLDAVLAQRHQAQQDVSRALEARSQADVAQAEKALGLAEDKVKSVLNKNFKTGADLKEMVTWESYNAGREKGAGNSVGMRRRYIPQAMYDKLKARKVNKEIKLSIKFPQALGTSGSSSIKPKQLDVASFKQAFEKIKTELKTSKEWKADPRVVDVFDGVSGQLSETIRKSDSYEVEKAAQWLRLVGGAGASAEANWKDKKVQLQGSLQGKLVLAEGQYTMRRAVPSLNGWLMSLDGEDLGAIRFVMECTLYGFAGAKVVAAGSVGITLDGAKSMVKGIKRDPNTGYRNILDPRTGLPKFEPTALNEATPKDVNGAKVDIDAFAGVEAGITPAGRLQWLPPQEKDFVSFADVAATVAGSAGAGAKFKLYIYYADGKFRLKVAAGLCWGVGAKGSLDFAVDSGKLLDFAKWFYFQLLHYQFKQLVIVQQDAFRALSQILVLLVAQADTDAGEQLRKDAISVDLAFQQFLTSLDSAKEREAMVNSINRKPEWLIYATPETRGMLLYLITRHCFANHMRALPSVSTGKHWNDPEFHLMDSHKAAVLAILQPISTRDEWANVMQHMSTNGSKIIGPAGKQEGDILRFLNYGYSLAENLETLIDQLNAGGPITSPAKEPDTGNKYLDEFFKKRRDLLKSFPKGYKVAGYSREAFRLLAAIDGQASPQFALAEPNALMDGGSRQTAVAFA